MFFFNDTATTEIYTLALHDALPISSLFGSTRLWDPETGLGYGDELAGSPRPASLTPSIDLPFLGLRNAFSPDGKLDRKSTRLNSSHANISYAVFCLQKQKTRPPSRR